MWRQTNLLFAIDVKSCHIKIIKADRIDCSFIAIRTPIYPMLHFFQNIWHWKHLWIQIIYFKISFSERLLNNCKKFRNRHASHDLASMTYLHKLVIFRLKHYNKLNFSIPVFIYHDLSPLLTAFNYPESAALAYKLRRYYNILLSIYKQTAVKMFQAVRFCATHFQSVVYDSISQYS